MLTTADAFDEFDENLKLDRTERDAAQKIHNDITSLLIEKGLITGAFLQGSFARKTMISPLRDVDKVVILHEVLRGLTPDEVMDLVQAAVAAAYPGVTFARTRHALQIDFGPTSFYFDTVPAWETDTNDDDVLIANRDTGSWDRSNTRKLIRVVAARNGATKGLFIHQVRMGKQAIKHLLDGIVPGLHVESWAYIAITKPMAHDAALAKLLATGAELIDGTYTEPTGVDTISKRVKPDVIARAKPVLVRAASDAQAARALTDAGNHDEAIRIWHGLFGDLFPEPPAQDDRQALQRSFLGGAVTTGGTVSTARNAGQTNRPVRPWRAG